MLDSISLLDNDRHHRQLSPRAMLEQLPAFVVLEGMVTPILGVEHDGTVVFANEAFANMLGHTRESVMSLTMQQIFLARTTGLSAIAVLKAHAEQIVDLHHRDGSTVHAQMSRSALLRNDDPVAVVVFHDLTEQLWAANEH